MIAIEEIPVPIDHSNVSAPAIGYASSLAKDHHTIDCYRELSVSSTRPATRKDEGKCA